MANAADNEERRRFKRFACDGGVRIYSPRRVWESNLVDISLKGALVEKPADFDGKAGGTFRLEIRLTTGVIISMGVTAAHVGVLRIGFHCERIDLDSFTQLKRLIELNLGDPDLLNRELSALEENARLSARR